VVGETADWYLNDVYESALSEADVNKAIENALTQEEVREGQHGGGAGMTCHMFPGGTGTSSRVVGGYTVGVLVQTNYGHTMHLQIGAVPISELLLKEQEAAEENKVEESGGGKADEGSIIMILMFVAPFPTD
jgi:D-aminopeptidase